MSQVPFRLYGIFGYPLRHTLSPVMQEAAFRARGLKAFYLPFEMKEAAFVGLMKKRARFVLDGFNVTVPYKGIVGRYLDDLTKDARSIKAVNTVFRQGTKWVGANTDVYGFLRSLQEEGRFDPRGKKILVLGAGGAARAVVYGLALQRAQEIKIANRQKFKARREKLIGEFEALFPKTKFSGFDMNQNQKALAEGLEKSALVVNATSVGVLPEEVLISRRLIPSAEPRRRKLFFDLVYHQPTQFLKVAGEKGHQTLNGVGMLVYQGAEAFRFWTGRRAPVAVMRQALEKSL